MTAFLAVEADGPNSCYKGLVQAIYEEGNSIFSRRMETKEIRPVMLMFTDPSKRFLTCPGRRIHPFFQVMESIWVLAGRGDVAWIAKYLKSIEDFSDGQAEFHAPYGLRMRAAKHHRSHIVGMVHSCDQFEHCYEYLKETPDTRHAVMTFWDPEFDNYTVKTIDRPCNLAFHFLIRDGKLDLTIFNRSNDIHWGLFNVNVVQFSVILETMAMLLGIPVGNQTHMIDSLHYYTNSPITANVLGADYEFDQYSYVVPIPFLFPIKEEKIKTNKVPTLEDLDDDLSLFFELEENMWKSGDFSPSKNVEFNFLNDALRMVGTFILYKEGAFKNALAEVMKIARGDLVIPCMEFLSRKIDDETFIFKVVKERFPLLMPDKRSKIFQFIISH